ncbi:MAG: hypothetical protein AAF384_00020 [Pseudomonadota bacterium]
MSHFAQSPELSLAGPLAGWPIDADGLFGKFPQAMAQIWGS